VDFRGVKDDVANRIIPDPVTRRRTKEGKKGRKKNRRNKERTKEIKEGQERDRKRKCGTERKSVRNGRNINHGI
jgi:hypothetical protein